MFFTNIPNNVGYFKLSWALWSSNHVQKNYKEIRRIKKQHEKPIIICIQFHTWLADPGKARGCSKNTSVIN